MNFRDFLNEAKTGVFKLDPMSGEDRGKLIAAAEDSNVDIIDERDSKGYIVFDCEYDSLDASAILSRAKKEYKAKFKVVKPE
jgi:hypothetical protein